MSNTPLDISHEWLVRLMWNEREVHRLDAGWTMWPWPLTSPVTLNFDFLRSTFKIAVFRELSSDWCKTKRKQINDILGWPHPWPWLCSLNVEVWNYHIWGAGVGVIGGGWHGMKVMWVDLSWPWPWHMGNHGDVGGNSMAFSFERVVQNGSCFRPLAKLSMLGYLEKSVFYKSRFFKMTLF